jgi:hypothetical protein
MSTRTEKFQRKPRDKSPGKSEEPPEIVKFSPEEEEVRPVPELQSD